MASTLTSQSTAIPTNHANDGPITISTESGMAEAANADESLTPRASRTWTRMDSEQSTSTIRTSITDQERNQAILTPDTASEAISQDCYAPSNILSTASLLSHGDRDSVSTIQAEQSQAKTKGRRTFEVFCYALDALVPIDVSEDVTSMSESSIGKLGRAVQDKLRGERG